MAVFITGASGRLGSSVLPLLKNAIPLVRAPKGLKNEVVSDFSLKGLSRILEGADALVHIAGSTNFLDSAELWKTNAELTKTLCQALPEDAHFVLASSISVYGKDVPSGADELTPIRPDTPYAKSKAEAERVIMARKSYAVLRIGPLYGPQFQDYFRVLRMIEKGEFAIIGDGKNNIPFTHVKDAAKAFSAALIKKGLFVVAGRGASQQEIIDTAAELLRVPKITKRVPYAVAFFGTKLREMLFFQKPAITTEHINILAKHRLFNCEKAKKELGFSETPIEKGIEEMVSAYKALR
ncbi:MAG: NAD(P)-dependent oxidoreductase [Candidatus Anstonellales archaeon]